MTATPESFQSTAPAEVERQWDRDHPTTTVNSVRGRKELAPEMKHQKGQRTWIIKVDKGMRPAQLPEGDVPCRYDDDDFEGTGYWIRIPEALEERMTALLSDDDPDYHETMIERINRLLDYYEQARRGVYD